MFSVSKINLVLKFFLNYIKRQKVFRAQKPARAKDR